MGSGTGADDPSAPDYGGTSYENRGGHRPDFLSIVVRAGVLGVSPAKLGRRMKSAPICECPALQAE